MKIKKPALLGSLEEAEDFSALLWQAKQEEDDIERMRIVDEFLTEADLRGIGFRQVVFENCRFIGCRLQKANFIDVRFQNCDLSNSLFRGSYFSRCELRGCKGMGADFSDSSLQQVLVEDCNFRYANFDKMSSRGLGIAQSDFSSALFTECKLKDFSTSHTNFTNVTFFRTPLRGIDFTENEIDGLILSDTHGELAGAVVNIVQAAELSKLLGIVIKERK